MTGQVKEQVLTRFGELGIDVRDGRIHVDPRLLPEHELTGSPLPALAGSDVEEVLGAVTPGSLAFTFCQVPVHLREGREAAIELIGHDGRREVVKGSRLDRQRSSAIFGRGGRYRRLEITVPTGTLYRHRDEEGRDEDGGDEEMTASSAHDRAEQ
jgi:hypothetical protein